MKKESKQVGRPSKLGEALEKAKKYLNGGYEAVEEVIPNIAGLACYLGTSRSRIYEYRDQSEEFRDILEAVLALQESKLVNSGLKGDFNSTITKLMLTKHGYSDKQELDHVSSDGSLTPKVIERVIVDPKDNG